MTPTIVPHRLCVTEQEHLAYFGRFFLAGGRQYARMLTALVGLIGAIVALLAKLRD
jgi:hypothetical protein